MKIKLYMIVYMFLFIQFFSCTSNKYTNKNLIYIKDIGDNLYVKKYRTYTGDATTSDSYSYYLTDSIHFRKFIGEVNYDNERIIWIKTNNIISVLKKTQITIFKNNTEYKDSTKADNYIIDEILPETIIKYDSVLIGRYNIDQLIKEGKFE